MTRWRLALGLAAALALAGCGDGGSRLNPFNWFGGGQRRGPETLEPASGFVRIDRRQSIGTKAAATGTAKLSTGARQLSEIEKLINQKVAELVPELPTPDGRIRPGPDGVLRLRFVASPPAPGTVETTMAADPRVDTITVARAFSNAQLMQIVAVEVAGGANGMTLRP